MDRTNEPRNIRAGQSAEDRALSELSAAGLTLVMRNFRARCGEIDLVMRDGAALVFVEVRLRRDAGHGSAAESIGTAKRRRLRAAANLFLARHRAFATLPARFDVVAFDGAAMQWIRGAFA